MLENCPSTCIRYNHIVSYQNRFKNLNVVREVVNLVEENKNFEGISIGQDFMNRNLIAQEITSRMKKFRSYQIKK